MAKKNIYDNEAEVVWSDRKRWCGLPWTFTRYSIVKKEGQYAKLVEVKGFLTSSTEEVNLYRVDDFTINQTMTDKMFGVGTITIFCRDASCTKFVLKNVKDPFKVRELLNKLVIEDRNRVGVRQTEMQF